MNKKELRKAILSKRITLTTDEVNTSSEIIIKKLLESDLYKQAQNICLYMPIRNEVDVELIYSHHKDNTKNYYLPKTIGKDMFFYLYEGRDKLVAGAYDILEPVNEIEPDYTQNTLVIMPGAVFTKDGGRIGYGGGYYDRFLAAHSSCYTVAVCYDFQFVSEIPTEVHDIKPQLIISDNSKL